MSGYNNIQSNNGKVCFCIGPEKCKDSSCEIVKRHRQSKGKMFGERI